MAAGNTDSTLDLLLMQWLAGGGKDRRLEHRIGKTAHTRNTEDH